MLTPVKKAVRENRAIGRERKRATNIMIRLHDLLNVLVIVVKIEIAELVEHASAAFLSINAIA